MTPPRTTAWAAITPSGRWAAIFLARSDAASWIMSQYPNGGAHQAGWRVEPVTIPTLDILAAEQEPAP